MNDLVLHATFDSREQESDVLYSMSIGQGVGRIIVHAKLRGTSGYSVWHITTGGVEDQDWVITADECGCR